MVIILLVRQYLVSPGCVLEGGFLRMKWLDKYCDPRKLGCNLLAVLVSFLRSGNGEWWMALRS